MGRPEKPNKKAMHNLFRDKKQIGGKTYFLVALFEKKEAAARMVKKESKQKNKVEEGYTPTKLKMQKQGPGDYAVFKWVGPFKRTKKPEKPSEFSKHRHLD